MISLSVVKKVIRGIRLDTNAHSARRGTGVRNELFLFGVVSIFLSILLFTNISIAQPELRWMRTYGGPANEKCYDHIRTTDGGYALVGFRNFRDDDEHCDIWILKTDENGDSLWSRAYRTEVPDWCHGVIQTNDNGYLLYGGTRGDDERDFDVFIIRTDENGDSLWSKRYGGSEWDEVNAVIEVEDGGYALVGKTNSLGAGSFDYFLFRLDENNDSLWFRTYGGRGRDECKDIIQTSDGGFALAGGSSSYGHDAEDFLVIFTDENGDSLWSYRTGRRDDDYCRSILEFPDQLYVISGSMGEELYSGYDILICAFDSRGERLWEREIGGQDAYQDEGCFTSIKTMDGKFAVSGRYEDGLHNDYYYVMKFDLEGNMEYELFFEAEYIASCFSILQNPDSSYSLAGYINPVNAHELNKQFFLLSTTPDIPTSVRETETGYECTELALYQSYPNPFNNHIHITYFLPVATNVRLNVFDSRGRAVANLFDAPQAAGRYTAIWNGSAYPSGEYLVSFSTGDLHRAHRVVSVK